MAWRKLLAIDTLLGLNHLLANQVTVGNQCHVDALPQRKADIFIRDSLYKRANVPGQPAYLSQSKLQTGWSPGTVSLPWAHLVVSTLDLDCHVV